MIFQIEQSFILNITGNLINFNFSFLQDIINFYTVQNHASFTQNGPKMAFKSETKLTPNPVKNWTTR